MALRRKHIEPSALGLLVLTIAAAGVASGARADQWRVSGQASQSLIFDSNIRLTPSNPDAVVGSATSGSVSVEKLGVRASSKLFGDVTIRRYFGSPDLDGEDFGLGFDSTLRTPRSVYGFGASIRRASTLITEQTDAGRFQQIANQIAFAAQSSWQYRLSPLETFVLSGSAAFNTYDASNFADQLSASAGATWQRQLSLNDSISMSARVAYFNANGLQDATTHSYALLVGWNRVIGERFSVSASAGPRLAFSRRSGFGNTTDGEVSIGADASLTLSYRAFERTTLSIIASQSLEPSSLGVVQERQRIAFAVEHRLSERMRAALAGSLQHNGGALGGTTVNQDNRLYFATSANLSYQITPTLTAGSQYAFRAQTFETENATAFSHGFSVVLTYSPRSWSFRD